MYLRPSLLGPHPQTEPIGIREGVRDLAKQSRYRSAVSGKFVTKQYADKHPKTTVKESVKKSK